MAEQVRSVTTNQTGVHEDLAVFVKRYQQHAFLKPIAEHSQRAFDLVADEVANCRKPLILDACCGVGESTALLAQRFPEARVIGVDKSAHRLEKNTHYQRQAQGHAYHIVRADLNDFWRLALAAEWKLARHYLLYPNPWPKQKHLGRRWYAMPVFPSMVQLGGLLTVRSNWRLYIQECAQALSYYGVSAQQRILTKDEAPMTPFERKYQQAGQSLTELQADLDSAVRPVAR